MNINIFNGPERLTEGPERHFFRFFKFCPSGPGLKGEGLNDKGLNYVRPLVPKRLLWVCRKG